MAKDGTVLVVDDDESITALVRIALEEEGYRVLTAEDGMEALEILQQEMPNLILLDMRMPRMNGWEFAEAYRANCDPCTPIVVVTAATNAAQRASEIKAHGWLGKPFDVDELIAIVQRHSLKE